MGRWYKPKKKMIGKIKITDPEPIWEVKIPKKESGDQPETVMFMGTKKAEEYFKAGFPVKLKTTPAKLRSYKELDDEDDLPYFEPIE